MRNWIRLSCAVLVSCVLPGLAVAGPAIDWETSYLWQAGATADNAPAGGELAGVGVITLFDAPFDDLDAGAPGVEYTFFFYGLISQGTVPSGPPATTFYTTNYTGGKIAIYKDDTPDATYAPFPPNGSVPSTFIDGELILSGEFTSFVTQTNNFTAFSTGNLEGDINWTGGSLLERTYNPAGEPCPGLLTGGITWNPDVLIDGYLFRHDGKIDLNCPVQALDSTWGRIKEQYR